MENRRIIKLASMVGGALISALLIISTAVFAYDQKNTHPALTNEIVNFYNLNFPDKKLTNQEKQWLIKGVVEEDTGERPLFHFYDPVHNRGIAYFSSKDWALKPNAQANYYNSQLTGFAAISGGDSAHDFSYGRALNDYAKGDRERAFVAFGHTLHLLEDAGVPDHTRNDAHPAFIHGQESPYEHEMAKWNPQNFNIISRLLRGGDKPVALPIMGSYFDKVANYSNNNFFSKDTISNETYYSPDTKQLEMMFVNGKSRLFIINKDKSGQSIPLAIVIAEKDKELNSTFLLTSPKIGSYILDGYWDRLSKEVVLNGAGALNLFLTEAEKAKIEYANRPPEKNWFARLLGLIGINTSNITTLKVVNPQGVDKSNIGDSMVTATPKVTNQSVSPTPLVTKTPVTNVTTPTQSVSPSKTPVPTPKLPATPTPQATPKLSTAKTIGRVVINEIAWAGTLASATDEWIELYNTETNPVDISSWQLVSSDNSPDIIFPEGTIVQANSHFLIERTDDNSVSDITADLAVGFGQGGLNNSGEMVRLFDSAGTVADVVGGVGEAWYFGDSTSKNSMERIDPMKAGNVASNWKSFSGTPVNKDATGGLINGTPKAKNSTVAVIFTTNNGGGGGGGGGSSSTPTPTPTPSVSPTPTPTPSPSPTPTPSPTPSPTPDPSSPLLQVVINEIAWMGTSATSSNDEWMELYNTTNTPVALNGWVLKSETDGSPNITLTGTIGAFGFYLIERTDDGTVSDITADFKGSFGTGGLKNTGEKLVLKDGSGNIQDVVDGSSAWFDKGTASPDYKSMERVNPKQSGNNATNWATNNGTTKNGHDAAGNPINGTPKSANSVYVALKPSTVANLVATLNSPLKISWSAPEDLDTLPASLSYDMRYSFANFPDTNTWDIAIKVASSSLPSVGVKGASQSASFDIANQYDQTVYFALKTKLKNCGSGDCQESGISNIGQVVYPTAIDSNAWSMFGKDQYHTSFASNITDPDDRATISWEYDAGTNNTVSQPVVSKDGDVIFGSYDGSTSLVYSLNKNGIKNGSTWPYNAVMHNGISVPAVLSDGTVYFGRIGAGGSLPFTALNPDGSKKWDYNDASTVRAFTVSSKGEPHFTFTSGAQDKLTVLKSDGSLKPMKTPISGTSLSSFFPVVLDNGTIIVASYIGGGNQFFNAYSSAGLQLWNLAYTGVPGNAPSDLSYDKTTGKTYSAAGRKLFDISSNGSIINATNIAPWDYSATTMVAIATDTLYVGFNNTNPASGSLIYALNKADLTTKWSFRAGGYLNKQLAVDKDSNIYFSTQNGKLYGVGNASSQLWMIDAGTASDISPALTAHGIIWGYGSKVVLVK